MMPTSSRSTIGVAILALLALVDISWGVESGLGLIDAADRSTDGRSHVGEVDSVGMSRATWLADVEQTVTEPPDPSWLTVWRRSMSESTGRKAPERSAGQ